jgi:uncharacterized protein (DUF2236 family)
LFIGGVAAVILELAEPRVRAGVWSHSSFRTDPVDRLKRTGLAAMVTVYAARSVAEKMIAAINDVHGQVSGVTDGGQPYRASDPELLDWVQATAMFGFVEAYQAYVRPLALEERDLFYAEGAPAASLYGAVGAPRSDEEMQAQLVRMLPRLERSEVIFEFLGIMRSARVLPLPFRPIQHMLIRAAVEIVPGEVRRRLGLGQRWGLRGREEALVRRIARLADRIRLDDAPAAQACRRLGLPADYLLKTRLT